MEEGKLSVLIVEDDFELEPLWIEVLSTLDSNVQITWTASVGEAESLIDNSLVSRRPYSVIITDIFVSGSLTGLDLLNRYRSSVSNRILIVSELPQESLKSILEQNYQQSMFSKNHLVKQKEFGRR
ncbi:MAG: hypothetical protein IPK04_01700 [Bdellovibrionales bacterium]|nr:hypothetical protein [Bdellovibrionales bacterium]